MPEGALTSLTVCDGRISLLCRSGIDVKKYFTQRMFNTDG